jgi:hypothetical protein
LQINFAQRASYHYYNKTYPSKMSSATMTMSPMLSSAFLNNQACLLIQHGRYGEAATTLRRALVLTKSQMELVNQPSSSSSPPSSRPEQHEQQHQLRSPNSSGVETPTEPLQLPYLPCATTPNNDVDVMDVDDCPYEGGDHDRHHYHSFSSSSSLPSHYIYNQPVCLPDLNNDNSVCYDDCYNVWSFAITFNLALASHLMSIELDRTTVADKSSSFQYKTVAKSLYRLSLQIKGSQMLGEHLPAAILNNISDVCLDRREARYYDQMLLSALFLQVDMGNASSPQTQMYFNRFLKNVSYLLGASNVAAAA